MIGISKLYCGSVEASDVLRYNRDSAVLPSGMLQFSRDKKPVVVWNCTRTCNLRCAHCYAGSDAQRYDELTTEQAKTMIDDLAAFGCPVLLFSGGEPTIRKDLVELMAYAKNAGMRVVISTNGTTITPERAKQFADIGLSYVGVSLDGIGEVHDRFRGVKGSYDAALRGIENARQAGIKVGLRFTINKRNYQEIPRIFDLMEERKLNRICLYHLVYAGRGTELMNEDLTHEQSRQVVRYIMTRTREMFNKGLHPEVLTVDNHCDGPFVYLNLLNEDPELAENAYQLLSWNQGNSSGNGICSINWTGEVYADQFWRHFTFGNVLDRPFSEIWSDVSRQTEESELMYRLKDKRSFVTGRCHYCKWLDICGGNFRVRAEAATGDIWAPDPACYLTDEEIGLTAADKREIAAGVPVGAHTMETCPHCA